MTIIRTPEFEADVAHQTNWYLLESGLDPEQAIELLLKFSDALDQTEAIIRRQPEIGQRRFKDAPDLSGARSHPVQKPFGRFRIFYELLAEIITLRALIAADRADASQRD